MQPASKDMGYVISPGTPPLAPQGRPDVFAPASWTFFPKNSSRWGLECPLDVRLVFLVWCEVRFFLGGCGWLAGWLAGWIM